MQLDLETVNRCDEPDDVGLADAVVALTTDSRDGPGPLPVSNTRHHHHQQHGDPPVTSPHLGFLQTYDIRLLLLLLRYDARCYFNVRSKADTSQLNLPHGTDN